MNAKEIPEIFGRQIRSLSTADFEKRTFNTNRFIKNGVY